MTELRFMVGALLCALSVPLALALGVTLHNPVAGVLVAHAAVLITINQALNQHPKEAPM